MLKDITLGQYFPGDTIVHRLDPRTKLILVILFIVALHTWKKNTLLSIAGGTILYMILVQNFFR